VAILSIEDRTSDPNDGYWSRGVSGLLTRQFRCVKVVRLLSDTAIDYALQKNGLECGSAIDVNQARAIGESIEAQRVVWGHFRRDKETWQVGLRVLNVATGWASEELTASGTDWFIMADTLADKALAYLQIDPNLAEKAKMRRRVANSEKALEEYTKAHWLQTKGRSQSEQEACLRRAMELDPNSAQIHAYLGVTLLNLGRTAEGERLIRQAIAMDPNESFVHAALAFFLINQGELAGAREHLQRAHGLDPDNAEDVAILARVVGVQKKWDEAAALAERACALDPFNAVCRANLAAIYVRQQQKDKALEQLRLAERYCVSGMAGGNTWVVVADVYQTLGEKPKVIDALRQVIDLGHQLGVDPKSIAAREQTLKGLQASLTPTFIKADMPQTFTDETLAKAVGERLSEEEMKAVRYPLRYIPQMKAWAEELTQGASTDPDKAKALLVDASWNWFGVPHKRYQIMDDLQVVAYDLMARTRPKALGCTLALKLCPSMLRARLRLIEESDPSQARKELEAMAEPEPNTYSAHSYWLAWAHLALREGRDDPLIEVHLRKAISIAPNEPFAHFILGLLLQTQGRLLDAREEFIQCLGSKSPGLVEDARRRLAQINEQLWTQQAAGSANH
jgi:tetratricopeptide (TPR) repeat protein